MKNGRAVELGIAERRERTLMMVLPLEYRLHTVRREADLSRKIGVMVRSTPEGKSDGKLLVCLTGEKDKLRAAELHSKSLKDQHIDFSIQR